MGPIVFCPNGHVFESRAIWIANSAHVTFEGVREQCPDCGVMAEVMNGTFDFLDNSIRVLRASQFTVDRLRSVRTILTDLRQGRASLQEVQRTLAKEAPELNFIARFAPRNANDLAQYLLVLIGVLTLLMMWSMRGEPSSPASETERIVRSIIEAQEQAVDDEAGEVAPVVIEPDEDNPPLET